MEEAHTRARGQLQEILLVGGHVLVTFSGLGDPEGGEEPFYEFPSWYVVSSALGIMQEGPSNFCASPRPTTEGQPHYCFHHVKGL